jgi:SAM-dependent methyltransferase
VCNRAPAPAGRNETDIVTAMDPTPLACPVCGGEASLFDVVDFNKACGEATGEFLPRSGIPIYYALCAGCGFCFAPEICRWSLDEFARMIYNDGYVAIDPDYIDVRPRANAENLKSMFGHAFRTIRHLDYGGGEGTLAGMLREAGWNSASYDPYVNRDTSPGQLGQFDLITAFEVFEHVPDPRELMSHLRTLLAPGGLVLFSTLLSDGKIEPKQRLTWWYAAPRNGHISLYSQKSLVALASESKFNLGSFSSGSHIFFRSVPTWASHFIRTG